MAANVTGTLWSLEDLYERVMQAKNCGRIRPPRGAFLMHHNLNTLRSLLERIARVPQRPELSKEDAAILSEQFRDCHLELRRLELKSFSEEQLNRIKQMDYRLQMVVSGHAVQAAFHRKHDEPLNRLAGP